MSLGPSVGGRRTTNTRTTSQQAVCDAPYCVCDVAFCACAGRGGCALAHLLTKRTCARVALPVLTSVSPAGAATMGDAVPAAQVLCGLGAVNRSTPIFVLCTSCSCDSAGAHSRDEPDRGARLHCNCARSEFRACLVACAQNGPSRTPRHAHAAGRRLTLAQRGQVRAGVIA